MLPDIPKDVRAGLPLTFWPAVSGSRRRQTVTAQTSALDRLQPLVIGDLDNLMDAVGLKAD
jgi:hypothetical protein